MVSASKAEASSHGHAERIVSSAPASNCSSRTAWQKARNSKGLGCDRFDHPPVTHRLNDQAAPATTAYPQAAASPDPKALHRHLLEVTGTGQLEVASAILGKALAVERPADAPAVGRIEPPAHIPVAPPL